MTRVITLALLILIALLMDSSQSQAQLKLREKATVTSSPKVDTDDFDRSALAPDGRTFLQASGNSKLVLWDTSTGKGTTIETAFSDVAACVRWSPTSKRFAVAGWRGTEKKRQWLVVVWDAKTLKQVAVLRHDAQPISVAFSPDDCSLATKCDEAYVRLWELGSGKERANLALPEEFNGTRAYAPWSLAYSPDGKLLAFAGRENFYFWDTLTDQGRPTLVKGADKSGRVFSQTFMFTAKSDALLVEGSFFDVASGKEDRTRLHFDGKFLALTADLKVSVSADLDNLTVRDQTDEARRVVFSIKDVLHHTAFSPDGKQLTVVTEKGEFQIWELSWEVPKAK